jgi:hypothetical protein
MEYYYFIIKNGEKDGPYSYADLIKMPLFGNNDIWRSDKEKWQKVYELEEFKNIYLLSPPPSPIELKKKENALRNEYFKKVIIKKSFLFYLLVCFILTLIRFAFAIHSYEEKEENRFRYSEYRYPNTLSMTETMYGNQKTFLFRALKPRTIYLSSDEQTSYGLLLWNLYLSNIISLLIFYIILLIYMYNYVLKVKIS